MNATTSTINALFNRIPRRHSPDNIKEINAVLTEYEDVLISIEGENSFYEKAVPPFFDALETIRATIKKSNDNKAAKKNKDIFFDEASGALKDSMEQLIAVYADGKRTA